MIVANKYGKSDLKNALDSTHPKLILAVDDEEPLCALTKEFLEKSGALEVDIAGSVSEAREALARRRYDAIVSDYQMPGEDGIQFLKSLRALGDMIPFILFTGKGREEIVIEAINNGADAYLQKGGEPRSLFAELEQRIVNIIRRHSAEAALQDSEEEFRTLFENNPDPVILISAEGKILNCNLANANMVLMSKEEIIGRMLSDMPFLRTEDNAIFLHAMTAIKRGDPISPIVSQIHRQDGTTRWVEIRGSLVRKANRCDAFQIIARDVTERKNEENALRQKNDELLGVNRQLAAAEEEMQQQLDTITQAQDELMREKTFSEKLVESLPGIFYLYDARSRRLVKWNKNHEVVSGYTKEEMLGKHAQDWFRPEDKEAALDDMDNGMSKGMSILESPLVMKDGRAVPYLFTSSRLETKEGSFFMGVGIDVTERREVDRRTQELYRELVVKGHRLTRLMEHSFDAIVTHRDGKILHANDAACKLIGARSSEDIIGSQISEFAGPGSEELMENMNSSLYNNPGMVEPLREEKIRRLDGAIIDTEVMATSFLEDMKPTVQVVFRDITERKRLEKELRESEEDHRQLISDLTLGVVIVDPMTRTIESVNDAAAAMFGSCAEKIVGHRCYHYLCPGHESACPVYDCGMEVKNLERTLVCADGSKRPILKTVKKINVHGKERMLECFMDISERERVQSALRETNKKLNLLSSITRHDINNQLTALTGYLELMEKGQNGSMNGQYLRKAETAAKQISGMIQFTKTYEDIGIQAPTWQKVHAMIERCAKDVHLGEIKILNDIPDESELFADPMISKVFLNLIQNSKNHGESVTTIRFFLEERDSVRFIIFEDDGIGIPAYMKEKLFTNGFGNGHGFGLFLSREILAITGIMITEDGEPGKGARFTLTLPREGFVVN